MDQVRLSVEHAESLCRAWDASKVAAASGYGGTIGVPAIFGTGAFEALLAREGDRGAARILRALEDVGGVAWEDGLVDIDTVDSLIHVDAVEEDPL